MQKVGIDFLFMYYSKHDVLTANRYYFLINVQFVCVLGSRAVKVVFSQSENRSGRNPPFLI